MAAATAEHTDRPTKAGVRQQRVGLLDWLMLVLAVASIVLLTWETVADLPDETVRRILLADYIICGIFFVEFLWRWRAEGWERGFVKRNWYEVLGMIPVSEPALRGFRLFRVVRIVILLARFGRAADRAFGDEFTYRLVNHFSKGLISAIKRPITVAILEEVSEVLAKGQYTRNVAHVLEQRRELLVTTIVDRVSEDPAARRFSRLPFFRDVVQLSADTSMRLVTEILDDDRTDGLIADVLAHTLADLRQAVRERDRAERAAERASG